MKSYSESVNFAVSKSVRRGLKIVCSPLKLILVVLQPLIKVGSVLVGY